MPAQVQEPGRDILNHPDFWKLRTGALVTLRALLRARRASKAGHGALPHTPRSAYFKAPLDGRFSLRFATVLPLLLGLA